MTKRCLDCGVRTKGTRCATCEEARERTRKPTDGRTRGRAWMELRDQVLRRDGYACQRCGAHGPGVAYRIHHVVPLAQGGTDALDNLVTLCVECHHAAHGNGRRAAKDGARRPLEATLLLY